MYVSSNASFSNDVVLMLHQMTIYNLRKPSVKSLTTRPKKQRSRGKHYHSNFVKGIYVTVLDIDSYRSPWGANEQEPRCHCRR